jgi:hypothetical protein
VELFRAVNHPASQCAIFGTLLQGISLRAPFAKLQDYFGPRSFRSFAQ